MYFNPQKLDFSYSKKSASLSHTVPALSGTQVHPTWTVFDVDGASGSTSKWQFTVTHGATVNNATLVLTSDDPTLAALATSRGTVTLHVQFSGAGGPEDLVVQLSA